MIVSLNKNQWLFAWIKDRWHDDIYSFMHQKLPNIHNTDQNYTRKFLRDFLETKGYIAKIMDTDMLLSMSEEEFAFLRLKYE